MRVINITANGGWQRIGTFDSQLATNMVIQARTAVSVLVRQYGNDAYYTVKSGTSLASADLVRRLDQLEVQATAGTIIEVILY